MLHVIFNSSEYNDENFSEDEVLNLIDEMKDLILRTSFVNGRARTRFVARSKRISYYGLSFLDHNKTGYAIFNSVDSVFTQGDDLKIEYDETENSLKFTSYDHDGETHFEIAPITKTQLLEIEDYEFSELKEFVDDELKNFTLTKGVISMNLHDTDGNSYVCF